MRTRPARGALRRRRPRALGIRPFAAAVLLVLVVAAGCVSFSGPSVPYLATPEDVGLEMLKLAGVTSRDTVYDLGSGDGRLVIAAARTFGARGVGVEIDPQLVQDSRENALRAGVADRVSFRWEDLFRTDISDATAVMTYLLPEVNLRLQPKLLRELRPGTPIVSHEFGMGEWAPDLTRRIRATDRPHTLYLWIVPASVRGDWSLAVQLRGETRHFALRLEQQFQHVWGSATGDGGETLAVSGTLRGDEVSFSAGPARATLSFRGRATGDSAAGQVHSGEEPTGAWTARRH